MHGRIRWNQTAGRAFMSTLSGIWGAFVLGGVFAQREFGPIASLLALSALLLAGVEISDSMGRAGAHGIDERILLALRTPGDPADPIGSRAFELAVMDITALGGFAVLTLLVLLACGYLAVQKKWGDAALLLVATIGGTLISETLKAGFARARPDLVAHVVETTSMSFPSGHAMLSAVTYLTLGVLLARTQESARVRNYILGAAIFLTLLIGVSRLYLGVHWPTDVLAGWCLGAAWALLCLWAATWLARRRAPH